MASFALHLSLLTLAILSFSRLSHSQDKPNLLTLPIVKDPTTNLFYTSVGIGTPQHNFNLVIDLGGPILWFDCDSQYNFSTYNPLPCDSKRCPADAGCQSCDGPFKAGCTNNTCGADILNPLAGFIFGGSIGEDVFFISHSVVYGLLSGCTDVEGYSSDPKPLSGLPKSAKGILGLARTQFMLPTQISSIHLLPRKFALRLPSSNKKGLGNLFIGGAPHRDASSLLTTPLIINPFSTAPIHTEGGASYEYFIDVKSIKVDGQLLNLKSSLLTIDNKGYGGTKLSTMNPFTVLHSSIYKPLVRDFVKKASDRKIKKAEAVAPFGTCFDLSTIGRTSTGLDVPTIGLELQGGVEWTINGANSMVLVNKKVACLGYVDGGKEPRTAVVIGGHQLEDNLLEFDLDSSKLSLIIQDVPTSEADFFPM